MWDMMSDMGDMRGMMGGANGPQTIRLGERHRARDDLPASGSEPTELTVTPGTIVTWTNGGQCPAYGDGARREL